MRRRGRFLPTLVHRGDPVLARRVVSLGEVLLDHWPDGSARPGGAPANVAFHVAQAGIGAVMISRVGDDDPGERLGKWLREAGAGAVLQRDALHPTGRVDVQAAESGPVYDILTPAAWDFMDDDRSAADAVHGASVLVFGTLAQRHSVSRATIRGLVEAVAGSGVARLADLNLRAPYFDADTILWTLRNADVLKLNVDELRIVSGLLGARGDDEQLFTGILREFALNRAVLTAGAGGAWVFEDGTLTHVPAQAVEVVDVVGAGDAVTAMLACGLVRGQSLRISAGAAAGLAAWIVSSRGATPAWTPGLRASLSR